ncbi:recombinase family protein, partial [Bacillus sp. CGMCC 1.60114]|uniref:recombinase family protein n=1 Tax=unclassified Bacillus (in: firmicutes) TaxID=185979 RepID=UPI0036325711
MKVAYARVSSMDQNLDRQIVEFKNHGAEKIFVEKKSGADFMNRVEFKKALDFVREGDFLMVGVQTHAHQAKVGFPANCRSCCLHACYFVYLFLKIRIPN